MRRSTLLYSVGGFLLFVLFWRLTSVDKRAECAPCQPLILYRDKKSAGVAAPVNELDREADSSPTTAVHHRAAEGDAFCADGYFLSHLLSRFIDIDFIEFVLSSQPNPKSAPIVDIGIYQAGELIHMAQQGFNILAFEPNPHRYNACTKEIASYKQEVQDRIQLQNLAVSDSEEPLQFQLAGLDSHAYYGPAKEKSIVVPTIPIAKIVTKDTYFVKIDTQGFDTKILESLLTALEQSNIVVPFIQFEFSPHFEVTRAQRSKEDHKKIFRRLIDVGYDVYQGAAVQPWRTSHRSKYGKNPLAMLAVAHDMPTCVDDFVEKMHEGREKALFPGQSSTDYGTWMDILAVRRMKVSPYYRHTGWVLSKRM